MKPLMLELRNRPRPLFGRDSDITALRRRFAERGLTLLTGRPQIGKSRVLEEIAQISTQEGWLVGYIESSGQEPDLLLRAVSEAYAAWLQTATWRDQAESLVRRHANRKETSLAVKVASTLTEVVSRLSSQTLGRAVEKALGSLFAANEDLLSGGIQLPRLEYDHARDLIQVLWQLTGGPTLLILDALDKSPDLSAEIAGLDMVARHLDDWPPLCHLVLSVRSEPLHSSRLELAELPKAHPTVKRYELERMQCDKVETDRLLFFLREWVPAARVVSAERVLELLDGYPGTLYRWLMELPRTEEDLEHFAIDAQVYRYRELELALDKLSREPAVLRSVAARLAILPQFTVTGWHQLEDVVMTSDAEMAAVLELQSRRILDPFLQYPSYGHATRLAAAERWHTTNPAAVAYARAEAGGLMLRLAARVDISDSDTLICALLMSELRQIVEQLGVGHEYIAFAEAAELLVGERSYGDSHLDVNLFKRRPETLVLGAQSLCRATLEAFRGGDASQGAVLLEMLLALANEAPSRAAAQEATAWALMVAMMAGSCASERKKLLDRLRLVVGRIPDSERARDVLASALVHHVVDVSGNETVRNGVLDELRALAANGGDRVGSLAKSLFNLAKLLGARGEVEDAEALEDELRELAPRYLEEPIVRESLARSLYNQVNRAIRSDDIQAIRGRIGELEQLHAHAPTDAVVRNRLARALFNALTHGDAALARIYLTRLTELAQGYPEDVDVRHNLAKALVNAGAARYPVAELESVLANLRELWRCEPSDPTVAECFAKMLLIALGDKEDRKSLDDELLQVFGAAPHNEQMVQILAQRALIHASEAQGESDGDLEKEYAALSEMVREYPSNEIIAGALAYVLVMLLKSRRVWPQEWIEKLRQLEKSHRNNEFVAQAAAVAKSLD